MDMHVICPPDTFLFHSCHLSISIIMQWCTTNDVAADDNDGVVVDEEEKEDGDDEVEMQKQCLSTMMSQQLLFLLLKLWFSLGKGFSFVFCFFCFFSISLSKISWISKHWLPEPRTKSYRRRYYRQSVCVCVCPHLQYVFFRYAVVLAIRCDLLRLREFCILINPSLTGRCLDELFAYQFIN